MQFDGDIVITDPCYLMRAEHHGSSLPPLHRDDWEYCDYGDHLNKLGIKKFITRDTIYGDWGCTTYNADTKEPIGQFCADAGLVTIALMKEVLEYNPDFEKWALEHPRCATILRDFHGEADIVVIGDDDDLEVRVVGNGNINFVTSQTEL